MNNRQKQSEHDLYDLIPSRPSSSTICVGVTGGIASGKTTVCRMLAELGLPLIDMDVIARIIVEPGKPALNRIAEYFGTSILLPDGTLHRKKLADIIFQFPEKRKHLEQITHPEIFKEYNSQLKAICQKMQPPVIQVAVPLLIESKLQSAFDKIIVVYVSEPIQIERLSKRDTLSIENAERMVKSQIPIEKKLEYADFIIRNDKTLDDTKRQVIDVWRALISNAMG